MPFRTTAGAALGGLDFGAAAGEDGSWGWRRFPLRRVGFSERCRFSQRPWRPYWVWILRPVVRCSFSRVPEYTPRRQDFAKRCSESGGGRCHWTWRRIRFRARLWNESVALGDFAEHGDGVFVGGAVIAPAQTGLYEAVGVVEGNCGGVRFAYFKMHLAHVVGLKLS
jgi:hypothetical protein